MVLPDCFIDHDKPEKHVRARPASTRRRSSPRCLPHWGGSGSAPRPVSGHKRLPRECLLRRRCGRRRARTCQWNSTRLRSPGSSSPSRCPSTSSSPPSRSGSRAISRCSKACGSSTGRQVYLDLFNYWKKIFAVAFGMGVVSGHRHDLPVRHQLERVLRQGRPGDRAADGLRGADRLLPRGGLSRRHAVRHEPGRAAACTSSPR